MRTYPGLLTNAVRSALRSKHDLMLENPALRQQLAVLTRRLLTIVDEYTRECLAVDVARRLNSQDVLACLAELFVRRGVPVHIRSDNGPEFTARAVRHWLKRLEVQTLFIQPGSPWENGYVESFNGKLRDECLNLERFDTLLEAQVLVERWRCQYNQLRPHSSLGYRPPAPEAAPEPVTPGRLAPVLALTQEVVQRLGAGQSRWASTRPAASSYLSPGALPVISEYAPHLTALDCEVGRGRLARPPHAGRTVDSVREFTDSVSQPAASRLKRGLFVK